MARMTEAQWARALGALLHEGESFLSTPERPGTGASGAPALLASDPASVGVVLADEAAWAEAGREAVLWETEDEYLCLGGAAWARGLVPEGVSALLFLFPHRLTERRQRLLERAGCPLVWRVEPEGRPGTGDGPRHERPWEGAAAAPPEALLRTCREAAAWDGAFARLKGTAVAVGLDTALPGRDVCPAAEALCSWRGEGSEGRRRKAEARLRALSFGEWDGPVARPSHDLGAALLAPFLPGGAPEADHGAAEGLERAALSLARAMGGMELVWKAALKATGLWDGSRRVDVADPKVARCAGLYGAREAVRAVLAGVPAEEAVRAVG